MSAQPKAEASTLHLSYNREACIIRARPFSGGENSLAGGPKRKDDLPHTDVAAQRPNATAVGAHGIKKNGRGALPQTGFTLFDSLLQACSDAPRHRSRAARSQST